LYHKMFFAQMSQKVPALAEGFRRSLVEWLEQDVRMSEEEIWEFNEIVYAFREEDLNTTNAALGIWLDQFQFRLLRSGAVDAIRLSEHPSVDPHLLNFVYYAQEWDSFYSKERPPIGLALDRWRSSMILSKIVKDPDVSIAGLDDTARMEIFQAFLKTPLSRSVGILHQRWDDFILKQAYPRFSAAAPFVRPVRAIVHRTYRATRPGYLFKHIIGDSLQIAQRKVSVGILRYLKKLPVEEEDRIRYFDAVNFTHKLESALGQFRSRKHGSVDLKGIRQCPRCPRAR